MPYPYVFIVFVVFGERRIRLKESLFAQRFSKYSFLIGFLINFLGGMFILFNNSFVISLLPYIISSIFAFNAVKCLLGVIQKNRTVLQLALFLINVTMSVLWIVLPMVYYVFFSVAIGVWSIMMATLDILTYLQYKKDEVKGRLKLFIMGTFNLIVGLLLIIQPYTHLRAVMIFLGVYFILFSLSDLFDFLDEVVPNRTINKIKSSVRITLPSIVTAFMPHKLLRMLNSELEVIEEEKEDALLHQMKPMATKEDVNMEVFIHVTNTFPSFIGHIDIAFDGYVMSFGNYDETSYKLHGVFGDGVLEIVKREPYLDFCIAYSKKTIFGFGICLTPKQKQRVYEKRDEILSMCEPWEPIAEKLRFDMFRRTKDFTDYASEVYKATKGSFYKFKKGSKFRSYFTMSTNCAKLASEFIGAIGFDNMNFNGLITPGTYYDYFNREYSKEHSNVITRDVYNKKNIKYKIRGDDIHKMM